MADTIQTLKRLGLIKLLLLSILLRLLLMPFYFHPDIKTYHFQASFLKTGVWNIYSYLSDNKQTLPLKEEFVYFPLTYIFLGSYQILMSPFLGADFINWLYDASQQANERIGVFRYLFILKLPYLILDLLIPFVLIKFLQTDKQRKDAFILWLFNPFSLAIIYVFSNVDIIPVTISLLSLLLFQKKKIFWSAIILAVAIGFKPYPILFLPFLLIFIKNFSMIIVMITTVLTFVFAVTMPFFSPAFIHSALVSNLTTRLAFPGIGIGFGEALMVGIVLLAYLFFDSLIREGKRIENAWYYLFVVLLLMFSSIHFHIQWLLWITPFFILFNIFQRHLSKLAWIWISFIFVIPLLYDDKSMTISLISTISPLYNLLPTPHLILARIYDPFLVQGIIHSMVLGISLVIVWKGFKYE